MHKCFRTILFVYRTEKKVLENFKTVLFLSFKNTITIYTNTRNSNL